MKLFEKKKIEELVKELDSRIKIEIEEKVNGNWRVVEEYNLTNELTRFCPYCKTEFPESNKRGIYNFLKNIEKQTLFSIYCGEGEKEHRINYRKFGK